MAHNATPPCLTYFGLFTSGCGHGLTLEGCTSPALNGRYLPEPAVAVWPSRTVAAVLRSVRVADSVPFAIKTEKNRGEEFERHPHVDRARVSSVVPLMGRCKLAGTNNSIYLMQWVDSVPCASLLRRVDPNPKVDAGGDATRLKILHGSVHFFLDMILVARLVDNDRNIAGRNILCQNGTERAACAGSAASDWRCRPLLHHDFDASASLREDWWSAFDHHLGGSSSNESPREGERGGGQQGNETATHAANTLAKVRWMLFQTVTWPSLLMDIWSPRLGSMTWRETAAQLLVDRCRRIPDVATRSPCAKLVSCVKAEPNPSELKGLKSLSARESEAQHVDLMRHVFDRGKATCDQDAAASCHARSSCRRHR